MDIQTEYDLHDVDVKIWRSNIVASFIVLAVGFGIAVNRSSLAIFLAGLVLFVGGLTSAFMLYGRPMRQ